jgi:hypothetical protein
MNSRSISLISKLDLTIIVISCSTKEFSPERLIYAKHQFIMSESLNNLMQQSEKSTLGYTSIEKCYRIGHNSNEKINLQLFVVEIRRTDDSIAKVSLV